jgi:hypothetical protein
MSGPRYPNLFIAGAAKAGTTTVHNILSKHPDVFLATHKEPHYFAFPETKPCFRGPHDKATNTKEIIWQTAAYEALFATATTRIIGECSNSYFYFPGVAERIAKTCPEARIIVVLRPPIDRTYSHYRQAFALGHESLSFEDALDAEGKREIEHWRWHYQYRKQSLYAERAKEYIAAFGDSILFLTFEKLCHDTDAFFEQIYAFLGIPPSVGIKVTNANETRLPRSQYLRMAMNSENALRSVIRALIPAQLRPMWRGFLDRLNQGKKYCPPLADHTRERLTSYFQKDISELEQILHRDLSKWKGSS